MSRFAFRALAVWWARRSHPRLSSWHYSGRLIFLRALGVLGGQNVFGLSAAIDSRYNVHGDLFTSSSSACWFLCLVADSLRASRD